MGKMKNKAIEQEQAQVINIQDQVVGLMGEAYHLKQVLNDKVKDSEYDPNVHLARRYKEVKVELAEVIADGKVEVIPGEKSSAIVLGGFKFVSRLQDGRKSLDQQKLIQQLIAEGLSVEVVMGCIERSTKVGEPFWVNEIDVEK